jgi:uncharacterized protein YodC (DUF2158 family)
MSLQQFKTGDTVELKSGGPAMTIIGVMQGGGYWVCKWWDGSKFQEDSFPTEALRKIEDE